jgi:hypothetical protein
MFDLWNYFFRVRRPHNLDVEMTVSRGVVIHVRSEHELTLTLTSPCPYQ